MGKWAQRRLKHEIGQTFPEGTDKTDTRGVLSVLAVTPEEVCENEREQAAAPQPAANSPSMAPGATESDAWSWPQSEAMNSAEIATFTNRVAQAIRGGLTEAQAEALADSMVQRDRHADDAEREAFEERAAVMEFDGGLSRADAETQARACTTCELQSRRKTCLEPVLAGLAPHFSIRFCEQVPSAALVPQ